MISTAPNNSTLVIWGGGMEISTGASITAGSSGQLYIGERCDATLSLTIGGSTEGEGIMSLSTSELDQLTSENIEFESRIGSIYVHGLKHPVVHMSNMTGLTILTANETGQNITFLDEPVTVDFHVPIFVTLLCVQATFKDLQVNSRGGINIHQDINTTDGSIVMTFDDGDLYIDKNVDIMTVGGEINLKGANSNITAESPVSIQATDHNVEIRTNLYITRNIHNASTFRIKADQNLRFNNLIMFVGPSNARTLYNQLEIIAGNGLIFQHQVENFFLRQNRYWRKRWNFGRKLHR